MSLRHKIFISYSHKDMEWLVKLQTMLKPLTRQNTITVWDDTQIKPGAIWKDEINRALAEAKVAVLLVSPHYLASDFISENELPPLLDAAEKDGLIILWMALSASMVSESLLFKYQALNGPSTPLDSLNSSEVNSELVRIAGRIKDAATLP